MSNIKYIVGIDYSMSSPSVCVHSGETWNISNCKFFFLTNKKKHILKTEVIQGDFHSDHFSQEERFNNIAEWAVSKIPKNSIVYIEDYAFAAKGVVFNIGECCGLLKHKLWMNKYVYDTFAPSQIKKFATGKGNANKLLMHDSFIEDAQLDISSIIDCAEGDSPISDIIDSYFIAKLGFTMNNGKEYGK